MTQEEINGQLNAQYTLIMDRKSKLAATDYVASKIAEGKATISDYADVIEQRQAWRDDINTAEEMVAELKATAVLEDEPHIEE